MSEIVNLQNHPTVKALVDHQARLDDSDVTFARRYIGISPASWSLIKSGQYKAQNLTPMLERCEGALQVLNDQAERAEVRGEQKIVDLEPVRAALKAVKGCHGAPQNRLVWYLTPSGGGKSTLTRRLKEIYRGQATVVEATEVWRGSYMNSVCAVAEALGISRLFANPRTAEAAVIDKLTLSSGVLAVDEGHYCGPASLNLLKVILNKTPTRVVLLSIPELWKRMEKAAYEEVAQLRRRTAAKIVVDSLSMEDCRSFLTSRLPGYRGLNGDEKKTVAACSAAANAFGLLDTLERICTEVRAELGDGDKASFDVVQAAIKRVEAVRA